MADMTNRTINVAGVLAAGLLLVGCASPENQRMTIGSGPAGDGEPVVALSALGGDTGYVSRTDAGASVTGLDRSQWERRVVVLPVDHTEHHPHFTGFWLVERDDATGSAYPTLESALEVDRADADLLRWVAFPIEIVRNDIVGITRLGNAKRGVDRSPRNDAYERTP